MKKMIVMVLLLGMLVAMAACSATNEKMYYVGNWEVVSLEKNGIVQTVEELEKIGNYNVSDFGIILKESGEAYFYYSGGTNTGTWRMRDDGIVVGSNVMLLENNKLKWIDNNSDEILYFEKVSNNQAFTGDSDISSETASSDTLRDEFKAAMDSYEAFYDEYIKILTEYKENPTNITILSKYTELMEKMADMNAKFKAWENNKLNEAEQKYYLEVNSRIAKKLAEATG